MDWGYVRSRMPLLSFQEERAGGEAGVCVCGVVGALCALCIVCVSVLWVVLCCLCCVCMWKPEVPYFTLCCLLHFL